MAGPRHTLTLRSKDLRSRSQGYEKCYTGMGMQVDMTAWVSTLIRQNRDVRYEANLSVLFCRVFVSSV